MICTSVSGVTDGRCHRALGVAAPLVLFSPIGPPVALAIVAGLYWVSPGRRKKKWAVGVCSSLLLLFLPFIKLGGGES